MPVRSIFRRLVSWVVAGYLLRVGVGLSNGGVFSFLSGPLGSFSSRYCVLFAFPGISFVARRIPCFGHKSCDAGL